MMDPSNRGDIVEMKIDRIVGGGYGFGKVGLRPVFAAYGAAGDLAKVRIDRVQATVSFGTVIEVLEPGPNRQEAPCPHYGVCGGCDLQHINYEGQLAAKQEILRDALRRLGGFRDEIEIPITASPLPWGYRQRAEWQRDPASGAFGYFRRGSHVIEDISVCYVLTPPLERLRTDLHARAAGLTTKEVHAAAGADEISVAPAIEGLSSKPVAIKIAGESFRFDAEIFFQTNLGIVPAMIDEVLKTSPAPGAEHVGAAVDLYCGVGLFTLPLGRRYERVVGVETSRKAVQYARGNARFATLNNIKFAAMTAEDWMRSRAEQFGLIEQIVVDPPRIGLEPSLVAAIIRHRPERIAYVSCDPATLARDLKLFAASGYELDSVAAFDMFPQTHHIEAVAHLRAIG
jgi:23S rRNA (uracil1939-C5)-methyltransferase